MHKRVILIFLAYLLLVSCTLKAAQVTIFDNPVCEPPCWQNITPGITTKKDALTILSKVNAGAYPVVDHNEVGDGFDDWISFAALKSQDNYTGEVDILSDRVLIMNFVIYSEYSGIRLDHAIELFGAPQSILIFHTGLFDQITLLNNHKGVAFGYKLYGSQTLDSSEIRPETEIREVDFFDPSKYEQLLNSGFLGNGILDSAEIIKNLHTWNGYGSFKEKYWPPAIP